LLSFHFGSMSKTLEQEVKEFMGGNAIAARREQIEHFRPIAREVLEILVGKPSITDEDLSGLIHLFRPNPVPHELASRYLSHIVSDPAKAKNIADRLVATGLGGFTAPGRLRIHSHTADELRVVQEFLRDAFAVRTVEEASRLCEEYEAKAIRYVTAGIYSPWLHYINPQLFPILNGATRSFFRSHALPKEYPELVAKVPALAKQLGVTDYGVLDSFVWHKENGAQQEDPKDGAWRKAKWIKRIAREDWEHFLDACSTLIDALQLGPDDPRLAMNARTDDARRLSVNLLSRLVLGLENKSNTEALLILPRAFHSARPELGLTGEDPFSTEPPAALYHIAYSTFRNNEAELLDEVTAQCRAFLPRGESSTYRVHHIPDLYRMATDADFREKALDHLLEGKGEWPSATLHISDVNYWIFQANPKWYDAIGALRDNAVDRWTVDVHKQKIKPGDKAIIWVTGQQGGCCALATVESPVQPLESDAGTYAKTPGFAGVHDRARITIDHNLWNRPITKEDALAHLPGLKAGNQGTNFSATKEQYDFFLQRANSSKSSPMHDLNTILYGPPGTGKTYHTVVHALSIVEGRPMSEYSGESRSELRARFDRLVEQRRIVMTTFHQSMSYEDFIEGIKPQSDKETGQVSYTIEPGIFKRACTEAGYEYVRTIKDVIQRELPFDELFTAYTDFVEEQLDAGKEVRIPTRSGKELQVVDISERGNIKLRHVNHTTSREYVVSLERSRSLNAAFDDVDAIDNIDREFRKVIGGSNGTAYWAVLKQVRLARKKSKVSATVPVEDLLLEDKLPHVERIDWSDRGYAAKKVEPFVLIIDEINRGNIAGIFGELITMIEADKRAFQPEVAKLTLPYSKSTFAVPPNLYILGTMNTADRSVEALDTALRRRFSFVEMPSRPELIEQPEGLSVELRALLTAINGRVERLLDKDHHIGHSYFMDINTERELRLVFKNKVLPLLQEYFYGDPRKLGAVLGPQWVMKREAAEHKLFSKFDIEDAAKEVYDVADPMVVEIEAFAALYA
jgi:hypothetical protein